MKRAAVVYGLLCGLSSAHAADQIIIPHFVDQTDTSGLNSIYKGEWQYMVGGGVATFDCNGDGFPDGTDKLTFAGKTSTIPGSCHADAVAATQVAMASARR